MSRNRKQKKSNKKSNEEDFVDINAFDIPKHEDNDSDKSLTIEFTKTKHKREDTPEKSSEKKSKKPYVNEDVLVDIDEVCMDLDDKSNPNEGTSNNNILIDNPFLEKFPRIENKFPSLLPSSSNFNLGLNYGKYKPNFRRSNVAMFRLNQEMDELRTNFPTGKSIYSRGKQNEFIKRALESLKTDDEIFVLNTLLDLSSELSMANDSVADDSNCQTLIKELISLFDKFYLPDISMSALTCLNYILDLNPRYTSVIIKWSGVGRIVRITQNIEYIDCAENAIKAIEKMSYENPFAMVENDAFAAVLSLIDFFDLNLRKSALKACVNMTKALNNMEYVKKFILPAVPSLTSLTKYSGNSEIEKTIIDLSVLCFFNVANHVKMYNLALNYSNFGNSLIQYGLLDNIFDLFVKFLGDGDNAENTKFSANILIDTFKNILRLFEILSTISADITSLLLNMNILDIIYSVLSKELDANSNSNNKKFSSNSTSSYSELFALLISFFPNKKSKKPDRLLSESNKHFFTYFSDKILSLLINNVVNIPSSNTMVALMKLLEMYIRNSPKEDIISYVDPIKLSNIAGKMVDSKDSSYITEVFNLVEVIMSKVPGHFFISFLREGVVDNIKKLTEVEENQLYVPQDSSYKYADYLGAKDKYNFASVNPNDANEAYLNEEEDSYENLSNELELLKETEFQINASAQKSNNEGSLNEQESFYDMFAHKFEKKNESQNSNMDDSPNSSNNISNSGINIINNLPTNNIHKNNAATISNFVKNKFVNKPFSSNTAGETTSSNNNNVYVNVNNLKNILEKELKDVPNLPTDLPSQNNIKSTTVINKKYPKNVSVSKAIQQRAKDLSDKFFKDEDINNLLSLTNSTVNPKEILHKLSNIKEILKNPQQVDLTVLNYLFEIMLDKNKITFYETEKSEIIVYLTKFFDENFFINCNNISDNESLRTLVLTEKYNKDIISYLKLFFYALGNDVEKITEFIKILQHCISSMNCFKLFLYEIGNIKNASHLFLSSLRQQNAKIKLKFLYSPSDASIKTVQEDGNPIFKETYEYFLNKKYVSLNFEQNETFAQVKDSLVKLRSKIKESNNNLNRDSHRDEYYEEIINQLNNRKGSEEDIELTQKFLQKLIERKKSIENANDANRNTNIVEDYQNETQIDSPEILNMFDINFFVVINNVKMDIQKEWSILDFIKEIRSFYNRSDYLSFTSDMLISFDIIYRTSSTESDDLLPKEIKSDLREEAFAEELTLDIDKNKKIINQGLYENLLFEKFYKDNIINNKSLYSIKRACPFIYLISLLELSVNNFAHLFDLQRNSTYNKIPQSSLENLKMTSLLFKQVKDPYAISSNNIPEWCKEITQSFTYFSGFNSRYLLFKISSFDTKRSMTNLYVYLKNYMGENILEDKTLSQSKRQKVKIDRSDIISDAEKMMKDYQNFSGYLEFEYNEETGTGMGPTLEFYSLVAKEMKNMKGLWYKTSDFSLFPTPVNPLSLDKVEENTGMFNLLGFIIARGLYDDRLLDFPINSLFWDLVLDRPISTEKITKIDKDLGKALNDFTGIIKQKQMVLTSPKFIENVSDLNDFVKYNKTKIEDIGLTFTLPGYNEIELRRGGFEELLTINNIEQYVALLFDRLVISGIKPFVEAFKTGFNSVFPVTSLKCFTSAELEEVICGCSMESWDVDTLLENINPSHGYDKNSQMFTGFIEILSKMTNTDKKKFLLFVTGSPRLPIGGFKNLTPKMTVVKKQPESNLKYENSDDYLPTVMTCLNYLKIPEYSSVKVLKEKLFLAMDEGGNAFHLS